METLIVTWLVRYGHVLSGSMWLGGYAMLAMVVMPRLQRHAAEPLLSITMAAVRLLSYVGTATILFGLLLITRTRGFATILHGGEWSGIVVSCLLIAIALLGIGDGLLRPALKAAGQKGSLNRAQRWTWLALILSVLAIGLMTRAIYASS